MARRRPRPDRGAEESPRRALLLALAGVVHLGCVAMGATHCRFSNEGWLERLVAAYGALSGADSAYGFFAPGVGSQLGATFHVTERDGRSHTCLLETGASHEADIRVRNVIGMFWKPNPALRRALAASWAGTIFGRYPSAERVVVQVQVSHLPSMEGFRAGDRPRWDPYYEATFVPKNEIGAAP